MKIKKLLSRNLDHNNHHLLTMGATAEQDYATLGMHHWTAWQFGYYPYFVKTEPRRAHSTHVRLLFAGSFQPWKAPDIFLDALLSARLLRVPNWTATFLGDGPLKAPLQRRAALSELRDKIKFKQTVIASEMPSVLRDHDIAIVPSRYDGWGAIVNEALSAGLAVIASDTVGSAPVISQDVGSVFLFPTEDSGRLASILSMLISNTTEQLRLRTLGCSQFALFFSPATAAKRLASIIVKISRNQQPPCYSKGPAKYLGKLANLVRK